MAASAVWHGAETRAAFCCKHLSAAGPPGCTPEHCAMKSDRHAARMALSCSPLGFCDEAGVAGAGLASRIGSVRFAAGAGATGAGCDVSAAGGGRTGAGSAASVCTACWHAGDRFDALPFRQSNNSGLFGAIHEQCAMKSSIVQTLRTILSCSSCDCAVAAAGAAAGVCGLSGEPRLGCGAVGSLAAGTTALTAVLQDADNLASLRLRHSNASLPPGCTPEQLAMKSERHDA